MQIRKLFVSVANPIQDLFDGLQIPVPLGYFSTVFPSMDMYKIDCIKLLMLTTRYGDP